MDLDLLKVFEAVHEDRILLSLLGCGDSATGV
jgi:hypothetical protein